jgi:hypothetical protein
LVDAEDEVAISGKGFLRFFEVGTTEVGTGAGAGVGAGEAVETGESASGDWAASARTCKAAVAALLLPRDADLDLALKSDLYGPFAGKPWLSPPPRPALSSGVFT